jgi:hypothetical protein
MLLATAALAAAPAAEAAFGPPVELATGSYALAGAHGMDGHGTALAVLPVQPTANQLTSNLVAVDVAGG